MSSGLQLLLSPLAFCVIVFFVFVVLQTDSVTGKFIDPLEQPPLEANDPRMVSGTSLEESSEEMTVFLQRELIKNLTKRVEDLEQIFKTIGLDKKHTVIRTSKRNRRRRTVDDTGRGDTNQSGYGQQSGHVMNPYWIGQCILCPTGPPGPPGPIGPQGVTGRDGRDGRDSTLGYPIAAETLNQNEAHPTTQPMPVNDWNHLNGNDNSSGVIYTRWGRNECPPSAEMVYEGIAAGAHYTHAGSGSNYLCLPLEPIYDRPWPGNQGEAGALIYGAEYQTGGFAPFSGLHDHEVPCAVCRAPSRTSHLMLPARNECPDSSWTTEYTGWLVAAHHSHKRSEFNCMDKEPEAVPRTATNQDGALFYLVEGKCASNGGLPCGPYVEGYELTCSVCTR